MTSRKAIDVIVYPFTPETKAGPYAATPQLKGSLSHIGVWDNEFTAQQLLAEMDESGVEHCLIPAQAGGSWKVSVDYIREFVRANSNRLHGLYGIDPRNIVDGVQELERSIIDFGFVGAHSYPHWFQLRPDDRTYYPFYSKCVELDVPVQIQVGLAWQTRLRSVATPESIDRIAVDFPDLRIIGIHTGYPWEREMIAVAWKHPNVYVGADAHPPSRWPQDLIDFIKGGGPKGVTGGGKTKVMWGTNKPDQHQAESLAELVDLGIEDEIVDNLIYNNAARVYRLPPL